MKFGDYIYVRPLGQGGQGMVGLYRHKDDPNDLYAIKFDPVGAQNILSECLFMRNFVSKGKHLLTRAPSYTLHNVTGGRRHLIMQYLEDDLDDYLCKVPQGEARDLEIIRLAEQMLDCI